MDRDGLTHPREIKIISVVVLTAIVLVLSVVTFIRNRVFQDEHVLWRDTVTKSPNKARPHYQVGLSYDRKEQFEEAIQAYRTAVRLALVERWETVADRARNNL